MAYDMIVRRILGIGGFPEFVQGSGAPIAR